MNLDYLGYFATALFASSYLVKNPTRLRVIQAAAALVWIAYGLAIHSLPVVTANLIVTVLALASTLRRPRAGAA